MRRKNIVLCNEDPYENGFQSAENEENCDDDDVVGVVWFLGDARLEGLYEIVQGEEGHVAGRGGPCGREEALWPGGEALWRRPGPSPLERVVGLRTSPSP
uniref:Uncharacterized protein n=1 Tax=Lygus hesperus TaxID=30085 RepID=A0A0K8T9G8_LYGHE